MSHLVILVGDPFEKGTVLSLQEDSVIIGRSSKEGIPSLAFDNAFISRKHAVLTKMESGYYIEDTGSRHGTFVNGSPLTSFKKHELKHQDEISLSNGIVRLRYVESVLEETLELPAIPVENNTFDGRGTLDSVKNEWIINGECIKLTPKEFACLQSLLLSEAGYVSKQQLIAEVWPERTEQQGALSVSSEELNAVIYRLRKKVAPILQIQNIRGKGYELV
ncbi:FHA domain-containing protein [Halobacillus salinus]|uniref:FHA domain-containing protein n=1 Tax=Halobacillus salinus TaxID=192814 RepID=A0A4Z0H1B6_9BACI|nr:FHA domain-containing protein [Halobacillus salinus]TGB03779.1 FHA domain-containing protein [Halobacillus salinus]